MFLQAWKENRLILYVMENRLILYVIVEKNWIMRRLVEKEE